MFRVLAGAAWMAAPVGVWAQGEYSTGSAATANPLQVLGQGARPLAMGSAFTAVKGDLMAALFNPAGQAYLRGAQASVHHNTWVGDINQDSLAAVLAGPALSVGLYGDLINYGAIEGLDERGEATGSFTPMDFTLGLAVARQFNNGLALGATLRGTQQSIRDSGQLISAGDFGLMWAAPSQPVTLGLAYANLGPAINGRQPTSALRLGLSYDLAVTQRSSVLFAVGGSGLNNGASVVQLGVEGRLNRVFFLRSGYQLSFLNNETGGLTGLSSGLGAKLGVLVLDYAYLPYGRIGNSHRLSVSFQFDDGSNDAPQVQAADPTPVAALPRPQSVQQPTHSPVQPADLGAGSGGSVDMVFEVPSNGEEVLLQAVKDRPRDAAAWKALGRHYYEKRDKARMLEAYRRASDLDPTDRALKDWLEKMGR